MTTFKDMLPLVRPFATRCPDAHMVNALRVAAQRFCYRSRFLRETLTVALTESQAIYTLSSNETGQEVFGVHAVTYKDRHLSPRSREELVGFEEGQRDAPQFYYYEPPGTLIVDPAPYEDNATDCKATVYLQPASDATQVPEALARTWDDALADGALAWLLIQDGWHEGRGRD